MNRGARLVVWGILAAALTAGPGCMLLDDCDDCEQYSSEYRRERPPQVSEYPAPTGDHAAPGVYSGTER